MIQHYDFIETVSFMDRLTDRWMDRKKDKRKKEMEGKTEDQVLYMENKLETSTNRVT